MQKLLIINKQQFGYLVDSYKWCQYLKDNFQITYLCFDIGLKKQELSGIKVKYISYTGNVLLRGIRFFLYALFYSFFFKGGVLVIYFERCILLKKLLPWKKMLLDIRTLSVSSNIEKREKYDREVRKACQCYDIISVISEGIKNKIGLAKKNFHILPLGSDVISTTPKSYNKFRLLYVGTFSGREIDKTIKGFSLFLKKHKDVNLFYDIVGDGCNGELDLYKQLAHNLGLDKYIHFHGRIPHSELTSFFDKCSYGISFVPLTEYYDHQPPTKIFEYVLSGLFCVATATSSSKELINKDNGLLIDDTVEAFADALEYIYIHNENIIMDKIQSSLSEYTWYKIVNEKLIPILKLLYDK